MTYEAQRDKVREELALLEIKSHETKLDELDVEGLLAFSEEYLTDSARLWFEAPPDQKGRLQSVFFPARISFDGKEFGTAITCLALNKLDDYSGSKSVWRPHRDSNPGLGLERAAS